MKTSSFLICSLLALLLMFLPVYAYAPVEAVGDVETIRAIQNENGVRVVFNDADLFFNASNGGEITEYYDLSLDPSRSKNLVNISMSGPFYNLFPLFTSCFYNPYNGTVLSTGGDFNATVGLVANTSDYIAVQASSRIMTHSGLIAKDTGDNPIYINTTWLFQDDNTILVERTFHSDAPVSIYSGWRWYPFYLSRVKGFDQNATFYMYNTTYATNDTVSGGTYVNKYSHYPVIPEDEKGIFGVAVPFANTTLGGDGTHNIFIAYRHEELVNVSEWKSDNFHIGGKNQITESGPVHEFAEQFETGAHTYRMLIALSHSPVTEKTVSDFANYFGNIKRKWILVESRLLADKLVCSPGENLTMRVAGKSHVNLTGATARLVAMNEDGNVVYTKRYDSVDLLGGQVFSGTIFRGRVGSVPGDYTVLFQIVSSMRIPISADSVVITVVV